ncbi:MAG TPA: hypothetical protein VFD36_28280, partial [Kofleriaceae bacterium]|nr:hypothetical protein [Kofleriaceae bacterium]
VAQLADVSRPRVAHERGHRVGCEAERRATGALARRCDELARQRRELVDARRGGIDSVIPFRR